ncbi:DUF1236 domain-containing protein [Chelatococcus reniformis]|uniref:DUF1236 domain-containing protein n=1 Tax=Chelatococcus reniformis TaxID=1494448 RepID=A0A916UNY7_9HYPH|nr:DUF1236 domain-containing protein [Chelatococcus reniformis]GGC80726.1 hypothetical protein GCM10010994_43400 [Chelatococcus reniformis]
MDEPGARGQMGPRDQTGSIGRDVNITTEQRTQITRSFSSVKVEPTTNVNFTVSTGTVVPTTIELHAVPAEIVRIVPEWRRYRYIVVRDQIVIIEPGTRKIITIIERTG